MLLSGISERSSSLAPDSESKRIQIFDSQLETLEWKLDSLVAASPVGNFQYYTLLEVSNILRSLRRMANEPLLESALNSALNRQQQNGGQQQGRSRLRSRLLAAEAQGGRRISKNNLSQLDFSNRNPRRKRNFESAEKDTSQATKNQKDSERPNFKLSSHYDFKLKLDHHKSNAFNPNKKMKNNEIFPSHGNAAVFPDGGNTSNHSALIQHQNRNSRNLNFNRKQTEQQQQKHFSNFFRTPPHPHPSLYYSSAVDPKPNMSSYKGDVSSLLGGARRDMNAVSSGMPISQQYHHNQLHTTPERRGVFPNESDPVTIKIQEPSANSGQLFGSYSLGGNRNRSSDNNNDVGVRGKILLSPNLMRSDERNASVSPANNMGFDSNSSTGPTEEISAANTVRSGSSLSSPERKEREIQNVEAEAAAMMLRMKTNSFQGKQQEGSGSGAKQQQQQQQQQKQQQQQQQQQQQLQPEVMSAVHPKVKLSLASPWERKDLNNNHRTGGGDLQTTTLSPPQAHLNRHLNNHHNHNNNNLINNRNVNIGNNIDGDTVASNKLPLPALNSMGFAARRLPHRAPAAIAVRPAGILPPMQQGWRGKAAFSAASAAVPKRFFCPHCNKGFKQRCNLTAHIRIHTGEKPYVCEYCKKDFAQISNMKRHRRIHETGAEKHQQ